MQNKYEEAQTEILHLREQLNEQFQNNYKLISENQFLKSQLPDLQPTNRRSSLQSHKGVDMRWL